MAELYGTTRTMRETQSLLIQRLLQCLGPFNSIFIVVAFSRYAKITTNLWKGSVKASRRVHCDREPAIFPRCVGQRLVGKKRVEAVWAQPCKDKDAILDVSAQTIIITRRAQGVAASVFLSEDKAATATRRQKGERELGGRREG